jgi:hypothetical protein
MKSGGSFNRWKKEQKWLLKTVKKSKRITTKFTRYAKTGQLKNGKWFCKSGKPITEERIFKYENMCHFMVRKFLPAQALYEAAMTYEDLINQCRMEVFLALLDGFDPIKAMTCKVEDSELRDAIIQKKLENKERTLEKAEISIVYGRLQNYLRRTTWKFHPDQLGGRSQSLEEINDGINQEFKKQCYTPIDPFSDTVLEHKERLLEIIESMNRGSAARAKLAFNRLKKKDPEMAEAVVDYLRQK